ncbi:putative ATP-dependent helicase IRC3 [Polyrhizophydium stewartii]|uniref:ATP-dependent helicase IRC3 n=1 Tax=Polyrhizophydium stewartii TaxID=2732419 RepID=A0ABR4N8F3_9FUNG
MQVIFANLIPMIEPPIPTATKTLIIAHREELIKQAHNQIKTHCPWLTLSVDMGNKKADMSADVIIASVSTLGRSDGSRLSRYNPAEFKCVIIDEAHHSAATTYGRVLKHMTAFEENTHIRVWGCSATLRRSDGLSLSPTFETISYQKPVAEMIKDGWLTDIQIRKVSTNVELKDVPVQSGDFSVSALARCINTTDRNNLVVDVYLREAVPRGVKSALVFAVNVEHVADLVQAFKDQDVKALGIDSRMPHHERAANIEKFRSGEVPVLVNCGIMTEGVDIPRIDGLFLARPTKSSGLLQQMLGRGMRRYEDKKYCLVFDFVDTISRSSQAATVPTLLGLRPDFDCEGKTLSEVSKAMIERAQRDGNFGSDSRYTEFYDPGDDAKIFDEELDELKRRMGEFAGPNAEPLSPEEERMMRMAQRVAYKLHPFSNPFLQTEIERNLNFAQALSPYAWVRVGQNRWVLELLFGKAALVAEPSAEQPGLFTVAKHTRLKKNGVMFTTKTIVADTDTIKHALNAGDQYLRITMPKRLADKHKWTASWRSQPPSENQLKFVQSKGIPDTDSLTRGDVHTIITSMKHGAKGASAKSDAKARRETRARQGRTNVFTDGEKVTLF